MLVPNDVRKCVAFVGYRMADSSFRLAGSMFFLGRDRPGTGKADPVYAVTARHVIDNIQSKGLQHVYMRVNEKDGSAGWLQSPIEDWVSHPTDKSIDVSIFKTGIPERFDHLVFPYSLCITDQLLRENEVGLGDEVFVTGLFRHHHGSRRNVPIVRVGNLACMTEEKIAVPRFGDIDAYLIEARSIGGLSGSPVFLNLGISRMIGGQVKHASSGPIFYLLGLVHGHFDSKASEIDGVPDNDESLTTERINTGIAIVVPFHNIDSVVSAFEDRSKK